MKFCQDLLAASGYRELVRLDVAGEVRGTRYLSTSA